MSVLSSIAAAIAQGHTAFGRAITLSIVTRGAFVPAGGTRTSASVDLSITAILDPESVDPQRVEAMGVAERIYRVASADLSGNTPSEGDLVTDGAEVWKVALVRSSASGMAWDLLCRKPR